MKNGVRGIFEDDELMEMFRRVTGKNGTTPEAVLADFITDYIVSNGHPEQVVNKWPWNRHED